MEYRVLLTQKLLTKINQIQDDIKIHINHNAFLVIEEGVDQKLMENEDLLELIEIRARLKKLHYKLSSK